MPPRPVAAACHADGRKTSVERRMFAKLSLLLRSKSVRLIGERVESTANPAPAETFFLVQP